MALHISRLAPYVGCNEDRELGRVKDSVVFVGVEAAEKTRSYVDLLVFYLETGRFDVMLPQNITWICSMSLKIMPLHTASLWTYVYSMLLLRNFSDAMMARKNWRRKV